jgi:hypothetical protein
MQNPGFFAIFLKIAVFLLFQACFDPVQALFAARLRRASTTIGCGFGLSALAEAVIDSVSEDGEFNSRTAEISLQELRRMADTIVAKVAGDEP